MTVVNNTILDNLSFINMTERALLLHSYLYYELDAIKISDHQFDHLMYRMVELKKWDEFKESEFYEEFKVFEGATGMDLDSSAYISYAFVSSINGRNLETPYS